MTRRIGMFRIDDEFMDLERKDIRALMAKLIVLRCEHFYSHRQFEYVALCDDFDPISHGSVTPAYDVEFTENQDGSVSVSFFRSENEPSWRFK